MLTITNCLCLEDKKGPVHTFDGKQANHFVSGPMTGYCSPNLNLCPPSDPSCHDKAYKADAEYFCKALYGSRYDVLSFSIGQYGLEAGSLGWKIHRGGTAQKTFCLKGGDPIQGSDCSGNPCKIVQNKGQHFGVYDVICSG